jgi:hypothetical protein
MSAAALPPVLWDEIRLSKPGDGSGLNEVLYEPEVTPLPTGYNQSGKNTTFGQGVCIAIKDSSVPAAVKEWWGPEVISVTSSGAGARVALKFVSPQVLDPTKINAISLHDPIIAVFGSGGDIQKLENDGSLKK